MVEESNATLFDINFLLASVYVTLAVILTVSGVCGNALIMFVMKKEKHMNPEARAFIINMAVADLCVSGIAEPMCIASAFLGINYLSGSYWFCTVVAGMCLSVCICAILNVVSLTVNKWLFICHDKIYNHVYNTTTTPAICIATWVISIGADLPNFFGIGGHYFDKTSHQCIWNRTTSRTYTLFIAFCLITFPLLVISCLNVAMLRKIWMVKKNVLMFASNAGSTLRNSMKSAKILLTLFLVFLVCWTPYVIVLVADRDDSIPLEVHMFIIQLVHLHSSLPCIVYIGYKKNFRGYLRSLFQRKRVHPVPRVQNRENQNNNAASLTSHGAKGTQKLGSTVPVRVIGIFGVLPRKTEKTSSESYEN